MFPGRQFPASALGSGRRLCSVASLGSRRDLGSVPPFKASPDLDFPARCKAGWALLSPSLLPALHGAQQSSPGSCSLSQRLSAPWGASPRWLVEP